MLSPHSALRSRDETSQKCRLLTTKSCGWGFSPQSFAARGSFVCLNESSPHSGDRAEQQRALSALGLGRRNDLLDSDASTKNKRPNGVYRSASLVLHN